jgi:hypothetical protein
MTQAILSRIKELNTAAFAVFKTQLNRQNGQFPVLAVFLYLVWLE